jgi:hypothetical protein
MGSKYYVTVNTSKWHHEYISRCPVTFNTGIKLGGSLDTYAWVSKYITMNIKRKTCDIRTWKKTFISRTILHQQCYTCPIALPVRRNPQNRSLLTVVSATSELPFQPLRHQRNVCHPVVTSFTRQTLPAVNRKHIFMNIICIEYFCQKKTHNRTLLFGITPSSTVAIFNHWHQPLNMCMRVCIKTFIRIQHIF